MKRDLKIFELYDTSNKKKIDEFNANVNSNYTIETNYEKNDVDFEWLTIIEETVRYLDNILRSPNRFIVNEEEVVQIEKARKITVESIKHLSKHTNFIQEIEENGDVKPSKILNINKEESYNTYENRFIYTLVLNTEQFIMMRKKKLILSSSLKDYKNCEYSGSSRVGSENVAFSLNINSRVFTKESTKQEETELLARIKKVEDKVSDLKKSDVFKTLAKLHVAKVIPPIKKTNLILKNPNFQYATKLWDYLQSYNEKISSKSVKSKATIKDNPELQSLLDNAILLQYLVLNSTGKSKDKITEEDRRQKIEEITDEMITKIVELNSDLPMTKLEEIIGDKIAVIRNKKEASIAEIQSKYDIKIRQYLDKIESYRF